MALYRPLRVNSLVSIRDAFNLNTHATVATALINGGYDVSTFVAPANSDPDIALKYKELFGQILAIRKRVLVPVLTITSFCQFLVRPVVPLTFFPDRFVLFLFLIPFFICPLFQPQHFNMTVL